MADGLDDVEGCGAGNEPIERGISGKVFRPANRQVCRSHQPQRWYQFTVAMAAP